MNELKTRLQELKDLQAKAHEEYLEAKRRVEQTLLTTINWVVEV